MRRVKNWIKVGAFSLLVLALPAAASAQYGQYDPYGRNGGGYGNGGYGDVRSTVRDLKKHARDFQRQLDRDLDRSRYNGTRREDQMNELAKRFKDAVNDLDNNGYNNSRNDRELRQVYDIASQIERSIGRSNLSYNSQNLWSAIRNDLQVLSRGYGYNNRRNNGGWGNGNGNGGYGNGGWNKPSWWPF